MASPAGSISGGSMSGGSMTSGPDHGMPTGPGGGDGEE
jgi:hypothetical protein